MSARVLVLAAAAALVLGSTGCGGDSATDRVAAQDHTASSRSGGQPGSPEPVVSASPAGPTPAKTGGGDFCASIAALNNLSALAEPTPENAAEAVAVIDRAIATAPAEIRQAVETYLTMLRSAVENGQEGATGMSDPAVADAFGELIDYGTTACPEAFE